jgi:hypothetical protein
MGMTSETTHPFVEIESMLANPPVDGLFVTRVEPGSALAGVGVTAGDIVTAVGDEPFTDLRAYFQAMRPKDEGDATRTFAVRRRDGTEATVEVPTPLPRFHHCVVRSGTPAWDAKPDSDYEPDFSGLADGTGIWLRCSLEEERAGFERMILRRTDEGLDIDSLFRIGGKTDDGTWDYRTRARTTHRLDRVLSVSRTAFWEGSPGEEKEVGDVRVDPGAPPAITPYTIMILPLTMPLEEGARITVCMAGDGTGVVSSRCRIECTGRESVPVDGSTVDAWRFHWRHYGDYGEEERFYVSDDRRLVRVDWGANYGGCWAELVDETHVLDGAPEHVRVE